MTLKDIEAFARGDKMTPARKEAAVIVTERILEGLRKDLNVDHYVWPGEKHWLRCKLDGSGQYDIDGTAPQSCSGALQLRDSKPCGGQIALTQDDVRSKTYVYVNGSPVLLDLAVSNSGIGNGWLVVLDQTVRMLGSNAGLWHYVFPGARAVVSETPMDSELSAIYTQVRDGLIAATKARHAGLEFASEMLTTLVAAATGQPLPKK